MQRPIVIALGVSLAANLALVAAYFRFQSGSPHQPTPTSEVTVPAASPQAAPKPASATATAAPPSTAGIWATLESNDLPKLVANLRGAGFPETTVRAIITVAVREQFKPRFDALRNNEPPSPFWKPRSLKDNAGKFSEFRTLARESEDLIKQLLGDSDSSSELPMFQSHYAGLPKEKFGQIRRLQDDYRDLETKIHLEADGIMLPEDRDNLRLLEQEKRKDLAALLTPAELELFDLQNSSTANSLRNRLGAFGPTEGEFRSIFSLQRAFDETYSVRSGGLFDSQTMRARSEAQKELNNQIRTALGEERYSEYVRSTDYGFRVASRIAERSNLPATNAVAVYDLQNEVKSKLRQSAGNSEALQAVLDDANARLTTLLGPQGAEAFRQNGGGDFNNIKQMLLRRNRTPPPRD